MKAAVADDVDAGREDAHQLVDVEPHRVVDDAVGPQREQRVDVVGGRDADGLDADELADVLADLVGRPGVATHQLEAAGPSTMACTELFPTLPVVHWTTRRRAAVTCTCRRSRRGSGR